MRTTKDDVVDVVFVHGLLGGVFYTWRQRNKSKNPLSIIGKNRKPGEDLFYVFLAFVEASGTK